MRSLLAFSILMTTACFAREPMVGVDALSVLMQADRDFARVTAERGLDGWMSFYAEDAVRVPQNGRGPAVRGHAAVREFDARLFADPAVTLIWDPTEAGLWRGANLGFTRGRSEVRRRAADGTSTVLGRGRYLTIWRKEPSGRWMVILDTGSSDPP